MRTRVIGAEQSNTSVVYGDDAILKVYRRLAPDSRKIELDKVADFTLRRRVLIQMGFDVGAIHAADARLEVIPVLLD